MINEASTQNQSIKISSGNCKNAFMSGYFVHKQSLCKVIHDILYIHNVHASAEQDTAIDLPASHSAPCSFNIIDRYLNSVLKLHAYEVQSNLSSGIYTDGLSSSNASTSTYLTLLLSCDTFKTTSQHSLEYNNIDIISSVSELSKCRHRMLSTPYSTIYVDYGNGKMYYAVCCHKSAKRLISDMISMQGLSQ